MRFSIRKKSNCTPYGKLQRSTLVLKQCKVNKQRHNICLDAETEREKGGISSTPTAPQNCSQYINYMSMSNIMQCSRHTAYRKTPNNNNNKQAGVEGREREREREMELICSYRSELSWGCCQLRVNQIVRQRETR